LKQQIATTHVTLGTIDEGEVYRSFHHLFPRVRFATERPAFTEILPNTFYSNLFLRKHNVG